MLEPDKIWAVVLPRLRQYIGAGLDTELLCRLAGAKPGTVGDWVMNVQPPVGFRLIALWHVFAKVGFKSPELESLPPYNRYLGELVAFGVITMAEACEYLNIRNEQSAFRTLRGSPPMNPQYSLEELRELHDELLRQNQAVLPKLPAKATRGDSPADDPNAHRVTSPPVTEEKPSPDPLDQPPSAGIVMNPHLRLAMLCGEILPLSRFVNQASSLEERENFRALFGQENFFHLIVELTALTSERARANRK